MKLVKTISFTELVDHHFDSFLSMPFDRTPACSNKEQCLIYIAETLRRQSEDGLHVHQSPWLSVLEGVFYVASTAASAYWIYKTCRRYRSNSYSDYASERTRDRMPGNSSLANRQFPIDIELGGIRPLWHNNRPRSSHAKYHRDLFSEQCVALSVSEARERLSVSHSSRAYSSCACSDGSNGPPVPNRKRRRDSGPGFSIESSSRGKFDPRPGSSGRSDCK